MTHITLVHQAALGDTILLVPLLKSLRQRFSEPGGAEGKEGRGGGGGAHLTLVTRPNLGQMLALLGHIDAYASADDREHVSWFTAPEGTAANSLPAWANCDLLISAVSSGSDAWATNARLAQEQMRPAPQATSRIFFEARPPVDYPGHITQWHREQLAVLELAEPPAPYPRNNPDGVVVIHPGSGGDAKCWPREKFLSLGRTLKRNGIVPTFILGEVEQERWGPGLIRDLQSEFPWYLHMGLYELAEKLSRARLYLGNDGGVTHLAAALGIPVIALFGPSNDVQWRPIGAEVLRAQPPQQDDLNALTEDEVLAAMFAHLRKID